jgi:multimeric flavodoxin WrbA
MELTNTIIQSIDADLFNLIDYEISPFDYEHNNIGDDFIKLAKELIQYDQIIFASPVYWYTMSAQMKVFFDRLSDLLHVKKELGRLLRGKSCAVISTGASAQPKRSFEEVFINSFDYLGMNYKGMLYCFCEESFNIEEHQKYINSQLKIIR